MTEGTLIYDPCPGDDDNIFPSTPEANSDDEGDRSPTKKDVFNSTNPFDVNYVPSGLDPDSSSPQAIVSKLSLIQDVSVYTTSKGLERKHMEFRKNASAPIDPDLNQRIQETLEREVSSDDEKTQIENVYDNYNENEATEGIESQEVGKNSVTSQSLQDMLTQLSDPNQSINILQSLGGNNVGDLLQDSFKTFMQDPLATSVQVLQNLSVQQQSELLQTLRVIQTFQSQPQPDLSNNAPTTISLNNSNALQELKPNTNYSQNLNQQRQRASNSFRDYGRTQAKDVSNEKILSVIDKHQLNAISILNEICTKLKRKVNYTMREIPIGKNKVYLIYKIMINLNSALNVHVFSRRMVSADKKVSWFLSMF